MKKIIMLSVCGLCLLSAFVVVYQITSSPKYVLKEYIIALKNRDYGKAYSMLSPDSKEKLNLEDLVRINEGSMTLMDENSSFIYWRGVMVGLRMYQDPGWWGFLMMKEKGKWKIVVKGGSASYPFYWEGGCK